MIRLLFLFVLADTKRLPDVQWISTNSIFDISNTDHVLSVSIGDRLSIECPPPSNSGSSYEYSHLYMVSEAEYSHCYLASPHLIGTCDNSSQQVSISIVFREFTPTPGGIEFKPGKAYFVTTTSNGTKEGIDNRSGGLCASHQMKLKFDVQPKNRHGTNRNHNRLPATTPVMYIIHADYSEEETQPDDSLQRSSTFPLFFAAFSAIFIHHLLFIFV
ncbi:hypothetical protein WR25_03017 [Diploscapter pachys]|uniref:Ephrin RBD domain-containing protein n=1 Tax=Diploscapter pachys TaxID=2018661 RepID=A0A2A2LUJ8_9BILA|nr:hypothetical protein WR25_03017 [Diploscapter pachys]